jgi:membrane fusion protein, multidrug efflux system
MNIKFAVRSLVVVVLNLSLIAPLGAEENRLAALGCMLEPSKKVEVGSSVSGVIESIDLYRGDRVDEGQVLFQLKAGVQKAGVEIARLKAAFSERKLVRNAEMFEDQLLSAHERDEIETESLMAKTELQLKEQELALRQVVSPISGVVVDRLIDKGEYVNVEPVISLATLDPLHIDLLLPYSYFGSIVTGQELQIRAEPALIDPRSARVKTVDPLIDPASGTFRVQLIMANPGNKIPAGLRCSAALMTDENAS